MSKTKIFKYLLQMWFTTWWWLLEAWLSCLVRSTRTIQKIGQSLFSGFIINLSSPFTRKMITIMMLRLT